MLDIHDGTPDPRHKKQCESVIYLLQNMDMVDVSSSVIQPALALVVEEYDNSNFGFSFEPSQYGARVKGFDEILNKLIKEDYIEETTTGKNDVLAYRLTTSGTNYSVSNLTNEEKECIKWVAKRHAVSGGKLLSFMVNRYPKYFTESD